MNKLITAMSSGLCLVFLASTPCLAAGNGDEEYSPRPNFNLFISNQSFAMSNVDISVSIDNVTVVEDRFPVEDQHCWRAFPVSLSNGVHILVAATKTGATNLQTEITISSNHSALLSFWCVPGNTSDGNALTPPYFIFKMNQPLLND